MNNFTAKLEGARQRLPLKKLFEQHGRGPSNENWKSFPRCPYCEGKQCAGVFGGPHGDLFKCHRTDCRSGTSADRAAWDEIGFLAFELNVDRREATRAWLKEAGLWDEGDQVPSDLESSIPHHETGAGSKIEEVETASPAGPFEESIAAVLKSPILAFFERCSLCAADRQELKLKRGLSDEMIDGSGFLTNDHCNLEVLRGLAADYPDWELVKSGLYVRAGAASKPSGQFYGYGIVGKKKRLPAELLESGDFDDLEDDDFVWQHKESGLCNPLLVPYFNLSGELVGLRPHKGFAKGQKPHLYLAGGRLAPFRCDRAVIVEGELKSSALQDIVGKDWAVASVPGITLVKNLYVWAEIINWLKCIGARTVVVVFDNEQHGDPKLSSFRPQLEDRFEAEIWARVCAVRLEREGYDARVGHLPDAWRDENGKSDWDSALAAMLKAGKPKSEIQSAFVNVLQNALRVPDLNGAKLFEAAAEKHIRDRVEVRTYEPALPWGGQAEEKLAAELRKLAAGKLREWAGRVLLLTEAYEAVVGWYYELKISEQRREKLLLELQEADGTEHMLFLRLALKGTPSRVASFRVQPYYVLLKPDGGRDRLVRLINIRGERSTLVPLDENSFTAPRDWRRWLARTGNYGWEKGEGPLQAFQRDMNFVLAWREVTQLVCFGCERPGGLWFLDDCAYADDGTLILPDGEGIFWHRGRGYTFCRDLDRVPQGEEGQSFRLRSPPHMQPGIGLIFDKLGKIKLQEGVNDDPAALQELLGNFIIHLNDSFGGYDGLMLISATVAFFGGPEIYRLRGEFPGTWITGEKGSGKTYTAKWLAAMHGFTELETGLSFKTSSAVGIQIAMGQYANMPIWGDEYKENELRDTNVKGVIHGGFNREVPSKWSEKGRVRSIRTNFMVTGETTCSTAATMSRFICAVASREQRKGNGEEQLNRLNWLQEHRKYFFVIGRAILQQRAGFAASLLKHLSVWEQLPELAQTDPRGRFSHGVAFAAFLALNEIIQVHAAKDVIKFQNWLIEKAKAATREISERVELNQFWRNIVSMHATGWFGKTPEEIARYFKLLEDKKSTLRFTERQMKDEAEEPRRALKPPLLAMKPSLVLDRVNEYMRSRGGPPPPTQNDLQAQIRVHPYFIPGPRQGHQKKFERGDRNNSYCWVIALARFEELGVRAVSDEDWIASFYRDGNSENGFLPLDEWIDPRKGELFALVEALRDKRTEDEE